MSIVRCRDLPPKRSIRDYVTAVEPVGYPNTALVCGSSYCEEPAFIWLEAQEKEQFDSGTRIFPAFTSTMKVRAK